MPPRPPDRALPFVKMQSVGNDFVLLDESDLPSVELPRLARILCDRHFGVGSDGLLVTGPSERADVRVRMFNPDGTEDHCGNGIRCAVLPTLGDSGNLKERSLTLETLDGLKRARAFMQGERLLIETDMGEPVFSPERLPMHVPTERVVNYPLRVENETIPVTVISTGTPHTVLFVDETEVDGWFPLLSPLLENHPVFPERTSVMWAIVENRRRVRLRIWERGVGETLGCGTGACAAMAAARLLGHVEDEADIVSKGGSLRVRWPGEGSIYVTGTAHVTFRGYWTGPLSG